MQSECTLSDSLNLAFKTYGWVCNLIENDPENENIGIYLESICAFITKITENSTPDYWSQVELDWIAEISQNLGEDHSLV